MENPTEKLASLLNIPVERTVDFGNYVEIIFNEANIGTIPSVLTPGNRIFDTSPEVVNNLRWDHVYLTEQESIDQAIASVLNKDKEDLQITIGTFRRLYVRDENGELINSVICSYAQGQWNVYPEQ
jgi:hypothetical protein